MWSTLSVNFILRFLTIRAVALKCGGITLNELMCEENEFTTSFIGTSRIFPDSKVFTDAALAYSPEEICEKYNLLTNKTDPFLRRFFEQNFRSPDDILRYTPADMPKFYVQGNEDLSRQIPYFRRLSTKYKSMAQKIISIWPSLGRKTPPATKFDPEKHTILPLDEPYIVPGGRFTEGYYWDTYWIMAGLLGSGMHDSARGMLYNLFSLSDKYGMIPNGFRTYFTDRTQPPFLSEMVRIFFEHTKEELVIQDAFAVLVKEHQLFASHENLKRHRNPAIVGENVTAVPGGHTVKIHFDDEPEETYLLSRYWQENEAPRIESFAADVKTRAEVKPPKDPGNVMAQIRATAESGWDFSSRWTPKIGNGDIDTCRRKKNNQCLKKFDMVDLETMNILPVDLNSLLHRLEVNIANFAFYLPDKTAGEKLELANEYMGKARRRMRAMKKLMFDAKTATWHDFNIKTGKMNTHIQHAASFFPIFAGIDAESEDAALRALYKDSSLFQPCGMAVTNAATGQQWDYPNVWPPMVHVAVEAFVGAPFRRYWLTSTSSIEEKIEQSAKSPDRFRPYQLEAPPPAHVDEPSFDLQSFRHAVAAEIVEKFLETAHKYYEKHHTFPEKFKATYSGNMRSCGMPGGGGEYAVVQGFGWTNGVLLDFIKNFCRKCIDFYGGNQSSVKIKSRIGTKPAFRRNIGVGTRFHILSPD